MAPTAKNNVKVSGLKVVFLVLWEELEEPVPLYEKT